jgi:adenine-specific DNA-methyltransferase
MLKGDKLPNYESLARYVYYTATGQTLDKVPEVRADWFIGENALYRLHLVYRPDKEWLRSNDAALNSTLAETIRKGNKGGKKALVFAAVKFMGQKELTKDFNIEFCQLPYALHRVLGD